MIVQAVLFAVALPLAMIPDITVDDFTIFWWLAHSPSLIMTLYVIVGMRSTIENVSRNLLPTHSAKRDTNSFADL